MLDNVTINQLRTFVAVCDAGSFSGAAQELLRAQSAVSHAVAALEKALGVELFERGSRRAALSAAGRNLVADARAVIARTEEMKTRARTVIEVGAPQLSIAADVYFPRKKLIKSLQTLQSLWPTVAINLQMTTMQAGEALVLEGDCAFALTISDVPELKPAAIERNWLCVAPMVTVCAPDHPLANAPSPVSRDAFGCHIQLVVTDNQPGAEKTQMSVAGERRWRVNDLGAKHDFLIAGLGWGHMPLDLVADDLASGKLIKIDRHAWHLHDLTFMTSHRRGHKPSPCEAQLIALLTAAEPR
ncbi:LysR family transcriptional regulator [Thalassospira mesophila]|uniref:LysR family transcriptional regulator n=1 Tax=Thalassospira mesophila TaxID=1293891 RepID=A0A1Y2KXA3_9PROT|nr:LysR family transcriptional regulator [Thalassospira mesophila]OSQ36977.1 LysR family transcriptional regulator [Thalassospira mesophila]